MIHLIYIYLIINSFIVGYEYNDRYRFESWSYLAITSFFLFFFGGILILYEVTISKYIEGGMRDSYFGFLWQLYIIRKYDNLDESQLNFIRGQISAEKDNIEKNSVRLVKHLTVILKRNKKIQEKYGR